jgi:predicted phage terminase large subunit-like protein
VTPLAQVNEIHSYPLHKKQKQIVDHASRFNIVRCGRRFGKTDLLIDRAIDTVSDGFPFGWFSPTYKVLTEPYAILKEILTPAIKRSSDSDKRIELYGGGVIEFWSMENEDAGKSRKYKRVGVDECAMVRDLQTRWENAIRPTLSDYKGDAYFCSTPKGLNYFYDLHCKAERGDVGWKTFHATTYDNPFISKSEIDTAKADLPSLVFSQEYMAEFVSGAGALIDRDWLQTKAPPPLDSLEIKMGVDFGLSEKTMADYTAIAVIGRERVKDGYRYWVLDVDRMRGSLQDILAFIKRKAAIWNPSLVTVEKVQAQTWAAQELLRTTNLPINALNPQNYGGEKNDKVGRSQSLRGRYEHGLVIHSTGLTLPNEFEDELLSFPIGNHDDMVDALVYAYWPFFESNNDIGISWL